MSIDHDDAEDQQSRNALALVDNLAGLGSVLVAFSGGVDSGLVLAAAVKALGTSPVLAVTADSASVPRAELTAAAGFAAGLGVGHLTVRTGETELPGYQRNGPDRCYICKATLLDRLVAEAAGRGFAHVATGTNRDDVRSDVRPGIRAGTERGIRTPLFEVGLGKRAVRRLAAAWGLSLWDKPASPCLASRIRPGVPVTVDRLGRVERAEVRLRDLLRRRAISVRDLRVRDLGVAVRVEVDADQVDQVASLAELGQVLADAGYPPEAATTVAAFRSGSLVTSEPRGASSRPVAAGS